MLLPFFPCIGIFVYLNSLNNNQVSFIIVSWSSKKQSIVTLSSTEAEFVAAASVACQAVWLRRILESLNHVQNDGTTVFYDSSSVIEPSKTPVLHKNYM